MQQALKSEVLKVQNEQDIVLIRKLVREYALILKFNLISQTKLVTAASELTRNILKYANSGTVEISIIQEGAREGIKVIFEDQGPGIPDIAKVMAGGYTTGGGLGLGVSGSKRLVDVFELRSLPGEGTYVKLILWK